MRTHARSTSPCLPKLCGADIELGNFILGLEQAGGTSFEASRALLSEIDGMPGERPLEAAQLPLGFQADIRTSWNGKALFADHGSMPSSPGFDSQDWGRKFLPANGGCAYVDLNHLELCLPEVRSAFDHVACWHALLRIARRAMESANAKLNDRRKIQVLANNSDGQGNSYGSHLNFLVSRRTWENIFNRKLHYLLYLATYQASSIVFTGQGKVGSENHRPAAAFQISQRADFFETLCGPQTTHNRPLVNSRDEPLCGSGPRGSRCDDTCARLHVIFYDNTLCHLSSLLKVGVLQILLSLMERQRVNPTLILDDPLTAVAVWSHDPSLRARAQMLDGRMLTAVELQLLFLEETRRFVLSGECEEWVPRATEILALWEDTLLKLGSMDMRALARRLDWVLKQSILQRALESRPELDWSSPQIKHLDHLYSALDAAEGLFWAYERSGFVEHVVSRDRIASFERNPPEDTRAWGRAILLRLADRRQIEDVDWDWIRFKIRTPGRWTREFRLEMSDPLGFTKAGIGALFRDHRDLEDLLESLESTTSDERNRTRNDTELFYGSNPSRSVGSV